MKIVIVGGGQVGFNIASRLVEEGHDVVLVERDETILERATDELDIQGVRGHGARPGVLRQAGLDSAAMLVAVTDSDEVNMVACLNAAIFGPRSIIKIARVRDPGYLDERFFNDARVAIDLAINPERLTADKILRLLRLPAISEAMEFGERRFQLLGLPVVGTSPLAGLRFVDLVERFPDVKLLIAAIRRGEDLIIPTGSDVILPGDELYVATATDNAEALLAAIGVPVEPVRRVMIAGGTKTARFLARDLEDQGISTKLVEPDKRLCRWLAEELPRTVVLQGSPTDANLLRKENISEMEAFVALSADEEANVMAALLAKHLGAPRVIAITNRSDFLPILSAIGIDVSLSPRLAAVTSIMRFIRRGRVMAVRALGLHGQAEALEFEAQIGSDAVGTPLHSLRMPRHSLIAGVLRDDNVIVPQGDTVIEVGDHVIVVALKPAISDVERRFVRRVDRA